MQQQMSIYVVTGAGSGLGRAIALSLMNDGHRVILVGRREVQLRETAELAISGHAEVVPADLATVAGASALSTAVGMRQVCAIVAAAGGQGDFYKPAFNIAEAENAWGDALRKNFFTALLPVEGLIDQIEDGGQIVLVSSTAGIDGQGGPYAAAKSALHGYCRNLARRVGKRAITVNVIAPGFVADTQFFEAGGFGKADQMIPHAVSETLLGRVGSCADIVNCARWLLSEGGGWITGQIISPNGGRVLVG